MKPTSRECLCRGWTGRAILKMVFLTGCSALAWSTAPSKADLIPTTGMKSLGSQASCSAGLCVVTGGVSRGSNRFHRFEQFDTSYHGGKTIRSVRIDNSLGLTDPGQSVFLGILNQAFINKPISLSRQGNLFILSPAGIRLQAGASFVNVNTLLLTTSSRISLGAGADFSAIDTTEENILLLPGFDATPTSSIHDILETQLREGSLLGEYFFETAPAAEILIEPGVSLSVDHSLLVVSNSSPIKASFATLEARGREAGDGLALVSQDISITDSTLRTNSEFVIREPRPVKDPGLGVLASPIISSNCSAGAGALPCPPNPPRTDTISNIVLQRTTLTDAGDPAESWIGEIKVTGWGCRSTGPVCPSIPQSPDGINYYEPLGAISNDPAAPGRLAYRGLDLSDVTIAPQGPILNLDLTLAVDWGVASNLQVISPPSVTSRAFHFQTGNGSPIVPSPVAIDAFRNSSVPPLAIDDPEVIAYTQGWSLGKISDTSDPANLNVSYSGSWWDGGDVTFNNIQITRLDLPTDGDQSSPTSFTPQSTTPTPVQTPLTPAASEVTSAVVSTQNSSPTATTFPSPPTRATDSPRASSSNATAFDQVQFNFDQTVFTDADSNGLSTGSRLPAKNSSSTESTLSVTLGDPPTSPENQTKDTHDEIQPLDKSTTQQNNEQEELGKKRRPNNRQLTPQSTAQPR